MDVCAKDISYCFFRGNFAPMYPTYQDQSMDCFGQPLMLRLGPKGQKSSSATHARHSEKERRSNSSVNGPVAPILDSQIAKRSQKNSFIIAEPFAQDFGLEHSPAQSAVDPYSLTPSGKDTNTSANDNKAIYPPRQHKAMDSSAPNGDTTIRQTHRVNTIRGPLIQSNKVTPLQTQHANIIIADSCNQRHNSLINCMAHEGGINDNLLGGKGNAIASQNQEKSACDSSTVDGGTVNISTHDGSTINSPIHDGNTINSPTHDGNPINSPTHDGSNLNIPTHDGKTINIPTHEGDAVSTLTQDGNVSTLDLSCLSEGPARNAMSCRYAYSATDKPLSQIASASESSLKQNLAPSIT